MVLFCDEKVSIWEESMCLAASFFGKSVIIFRHRAEIDVRPNVKSHPGAYRRKMTPEAKTSLAPPCSKLRSFGSKCDVLKKVLTALLGLCAPLVAPPRLRSIWLRVKRPASKAVSSQRASARPPHLKSVSPITYLTPGCSIPVVPKLGVNYPPGVICDSLEGNAEPKPQCCSTLWAITAKYWG